MAESSKKDSDPIAEIIKELKRYSYGTKRMKAKDAILSEKD